MKLTTLKDLETYLYSAVVLPLRGIRGISLEYDSPIKGSNGELWSLTLDREAVRGHRRQGPRRRAERSSAYLVRLNTNTDSYVVAKYNIRNHNIVLYEQPFKVLKAMILFGKMHDVFVRYEPFNKIAIKHVYREPIIRRGGQQESVSGGWLSEYPAFPEDSEGYTEEDI